jgi:hypothetical protein
LVLGLVGCVSQYEEGRREKHLKRKRRRKRKSPKREDRTKSKEVYISARAPTRISHANKARRASEDRRDISVCKHRITSQHKMQKNPKDRKKRVYKSKHAKKNTHRSTELSRLSRPCGHAEEGVCGRASITPVMGYEYQGNGRTEEDGEETRRRGRRRREQEGEGWSWGGGEWGEEGS